MLDYINLKLTFRALTDLYLPFYKGSTLRGIFKTSLHQTVCIMKKRRCFDCMLAGECVYLFLTDHRTEEGENTVLPYALSCASIEKSVYRRGEHIAFKLALFGSAVKYLPYVAYSLSEWEKFDVGRFQPMISEKEIAAGAVRRPRGRMGLERIEQISKAETETIVLLESDVLKPPTIETISFEESPNEKNEESKSCFPLADKNFSQSQR